MKVDNVILLEDDQKYLLLDETKLDDEKYFYATQIKDNLEPINNFVFIKYTKKDKKFYATKITDKETYTKLMLKFLNNLATRLAN